MNKSFSIFTILLSFVLLFSASCKKEKDKKCLECEVYKKITTICEDDNTFLNKEQSWKEYVAETTAAVEQQNGTCEEKTVKED